MVTLGDAGFGPTHHFPVRDENPSIHSNQALPFLATTDGNDRWQRPLRHDHLQHEGVCTVVVTSFMSCEAIPMSPVHAISQNASS